MWIRSAFWIGNAKAGEENRFRSAIDDEIIPGLCALPHVRNATALWPQRREDSPPGIACQVLVYFDERNSVDAMLASDERRAMRVRVREVAEMFDGTLSHIDYEAG